MIPARVQKSINRHLTPRIGTLIIPSDPFWVQALEAIIKTNQEIGDELIILEPFGTLEEAYAASQDDLVEQILAQDLDALICTLINAQLVQLLANEGLPVICMAEINFSHPNITSMSSLYDGGKLAGQYVCQRLKERQQASGHVLCVSAGLESQLSLPQTRLNGFMDAVAESPGVEAVHIPAYWSYADAYPALLEALKHYPRRIHAVFGISDTIILAVRDAGRKLGVFDDSTILVGLNGDPMALAAVVDGSLDATIDMASEKLGENGIRLAHQAALGHPIPSEIRQEFQLITRENVASFATQKLVPIAGLPAQMVGYNRRLEKDRIAQLEISTEITRQIGSLMERSSMIAVIGRLVREHFGFQWMRILRWSKKEGRLEFYGGDLSPAARQVPIEKDILLSHVFTTNEVVFIPDIETSRRWRLGLEWQVIRSRAVLPIQLGTEVIGILDLQSSEPMRKPNLELVGLKLLASQISIAIQNADLYQETRHAQEVAERANQLKNRLIANVGHEMRTPLNAILGFSQSVLDKLKDSDKLQPADLDQDVSHIYKSGEHLMYMINDLLDLSRAEIGALSLFFEPVEPSRFLRDLFQEFCQSGHSHEPVRYVVDVPERLPIIQADTVRLRQIVMNLLTNARKFTKQGNICLGAKVELPYLHLWVEDTGQGVPVELQERIFEPFSTASGKRRAEGIGLGLSITRHLVELHNGTITLESAQGNGSTFHVYLPLPGLTQEPVFDRDPDRLPILLVMTSHQNLPEEVLSICETHHLLPKIIHNHEDLNNALGEGTPTAIAWDLVNSSSSDWSLIYRLNQNKKYATLPVILFSGNENTSSEATGVTNILFKPCGGNSLKDWIAQTLPGEESKGQVLIVDDDPDARLYYEMLVKDVHPSSAVILAENGLKAIEILRCETPSLILLDLVMPEGDGFTVLEQVRSVTRTQRIPVIIISGKLLNYEDIQRLNHHKTVFYNKGILNNTEMKELIRHVVHEPNVLPQPTSMVVKQGLAYLHQNYTKPVTRREIAEAAGVSENYFSQVFRQEMSVSPWDYLARLRIHKAKELLRQSEDSVTHIALLVGFHDPAYFSRVFHKITGQSPLEFRSG